MLSFLYYLIIGYDNSGFGLGWYCEKVGILYVLLYDFYNIIFKCFFYLKLGNRLCINVK